nr:hypothetical protein BHI3_19090 [Bacteriovorax sp. HI3]
MISFFKVMFYFVFCADLFAFVVDSPLGTIQLTTEELVRAKINYEQVVVFFDSLKVNNCKKIGPVKNLKKLEFWQKSKACDLRLVELKKDVALLKGNALLIGSDSLFCEFSLEGVAYQCLNSDRE